MTNLEAHEAAGMGLDGSFFAFNKIDPDAEFIDPILQEPEIKNNLKNNTKRQLIEYLFKKYSKCNKISKNQKLHIKNEILKLSNEEFIIELNKIKESSNEIMGS